MASGGSPEGAGVSVLGMGRMGATMARRLSECGFSLTLWNRTTASAEQLASELGAEVAATPAEAAGQAPFVVASLADDEAVRTVHTGGAGTLAGMGPETVLIETSTVDPGTIAELVRQAGGNGAAVLDAPVSGSVPLVERGELTIMVGGAAESLERARPVLDVLSSQVFHLGPSGTGSTMKLAVNALVHAINLAVAESLVLAEAAGVDRGVAYDVLESGAAGSPFVKYKRAGFLDPATPVAFSLDLVAKDLDLILGLAARLGHTMEQGEVTATVVRDAIAEGLGASDMSVLAERLRRRR